MKTFITLIAWSIICSTAAAQKIPDLNSGLCEALRSYWTGETSMQGKVVFIKIISLGPTQSQETKLWMDPISLTFKYSAHVSDSDRKRELDTTYVGNGLIYYQELGNSPYWRKVADITGLKNRINLLLTQLTYSQSPFVKGIIKSYSDYLNYYGDTGQLDKVPQYAAAVIESNSASGFSSSTENDKVKFKVNEAGLITALDYDNAKGFRYSISVVPQLEEPIKFPPDNVLAPQTPSEMRAHINKKIFGFVFNIVNGIPTVTYVFPDSSYLKAGGSTGDRSMKIDDTDLQSMNEKAIDALIDQKDHIKLTIIHGEAVRVLDITKS